MTPRTFFVTLAQFTLAGLVLLLSHYGYGWLAVPLVLLPTAYSWVKSGRDTKVLLAGSPTAIIGLSIVVLVGLSRPPYGAAVFPVTTQVILTILYAFWLMWLRQLRLHERASTFVLGVQIFMSTTAIFLAVAFWQWPEAVALAAVWGVSMVSALWFLTARGERSAAILAAAWALVATELAWILLVWQVNYILDGDVFIIPHAALVLLGVGYSLGSIYQAHIGKRLSRRRLLEYVVLAGVIFAILVFGTRWNGTV